MKKTRRLVLSVVLASIIWMLSFVVVLASDITNAIYRGEVRITNNGTAATNVVVVFTQNTSGLIAQNLVNSSVNNTAIRNDLGTDATYMPGASGNNSWVVFVPSISGGNTNLSYNLYAGGNTSMSSDQAIFLTSSGMTTANNTSMELSNNFTISQTGFISNASGSLISKPDAFETYTTNGTSTVNVTSAIVQSTSWTDVFSGAYTSDNWTTKTFSATNITQVRIRMYNSDVVSHSYNISEVQLWNQNTGAWVSPSSLVDSGNWTNPNNTFDGNTGTSANYTIWDNLPAWSPFITLDISGIISSNQTRYWVSGTSGQADIDVLSANMTAVKLAGVPISKHTIRTTMDSPFLGITVDNTTSPLPTTANLSLNIPAWQSEFSGATFNSLTASGSPGNVNGASWNSTGWYFDGSDNVTIAASANITHANGYTEIIWFKTDNVTPFGYIAGLGQGLTNVFATGDIRIGSGRVETYWNRYDGTYVGRAGTTTLTNGTFYHIAAVHTPNEYPMLYINRVAEGNTAGTVGTYNGTANWTATFGGSAYPGVFAGTPMVGTIGEARLYAGTFNQTAIDRDYYTTKWKYDGSTSQPLISTVASVPNNTENWTIWSNMGDSYLISSNVTVGGALRQSINWEYDSTLPVVFSDDSGNGNTATPSLRTAGTSANITASLITFVPINQTTSDPTNPAVTAENITSPFIQPSGMYTELNLSFPGAETLNGLLDDMNIPRALFWFPVIFGIINLLGIGVYAITRSILIQGVAVGFMIVIASLMGGFGYWVFIEYIFLAGAVIVAEKQYGF